MSQVFSSDWRSKAFHFGAGSPRASVTPILQTEMSECGLACLAMIASHHGHRLDLASLRERHLVSSRGATLKDIIAIAGSLSLSARPLRLDLDHLSELKLPALLHWDLNHYVVLERVGARNVDIIDPGRGRRRLSLDALSKHFTGVALEFTPRTDFEALDTRKPARLSMLWSSLRGFKRGVIQLFVLSVLLQLVTLALPIYLQVVVDGVLPGVDNSLLLALAGGFAALMLIRAVAEAARSWAVLVYGNQLSAQMVGNIFHHLLRLPVSYFERRHVGDLVSRMNSTQPIQEALTQSAVGVVIDGVMAVTMLVVMFLYSPALAWVVLGTTAVALIVTLAVYPHVRRNQEESIHARAIENTHVIESIRASTALKLFGREAAREAQWSNLYADFVNANVGYGKWLIVRDFARSALIGLQVVIVVWLGARLVMGDLFSLGQFFAFLAFRQSFADAVTKLIDKGVELRLLNVHLDRISDIAYAEREGLEAQEKTQHLQGRITIEGVSFRYSPLDPWILRNVNLAIDPGEMVCFTGLSGGGKTTLLKLIMGLYPPTKGRILIDGQPLSDVGIRNWRSRIGVVMQDDILLSGTIADNISFFDPEADMKRVARAAHAARVHEDILKIPMNYLAPVGNMGSTLSGGQRQRVLLARALYHEPDVLFLDEGTANLDSLTESQIVSTIVGMDITRVVVAHRPAFLEVADRIVYVEEAQIRVKS